MWIRPKVRIVKLLKKNYMKILKCHCGAIEAEINIPDNLEKFYDVIVHFVKEKEQ